MSYPTRHHNTTALSSAALEQAEAQAERQEDMVWALMQDGAPRTPWDVFYALETRAPITSIRRAITNLATEGRLLKLQATVKSGPYNKTCHLYERAPAPAADPSPAVQGSLFE